MRILASLLAIATIARAETGRAAWLRYAPVDIKDARFVLPPAIVTVGDSPLILSARNEMVAGVKGMLGRTLRIDAQPGAEGAIVLGTINVLRDKYPQIGAPLKAEGFRIQRIGSDVVIAGADPSGVLYGTFTALRQTLLPARPNQ